MLRKYGLLVTIALAGCVTAPNREAISGLSHVSFPAPQRVAAGAITANDVYVLKRAGVREVISLRAPDETPHFDEAAAMRGAGIGYHDLPIHGADGLTRPNVEQFDALLRAAGDKTTLVHCTTSNRVGAMIALRAVLIEHRSIEDAIAEGHRWGLKALEPQVRERIAQWQSGAAADSPR